MTAQFPIDGARDALWMATAVPAPPTTTLSGSLRSDVVIIGAGFTGLNAALQLARSGSRVIVLEAGWLGSGASGRSGGQVNLGLNLGPVQLEQQFGRDRAARLIELVASTPDEVFSLIQRERLDCDAVQHGWIQGAISERVFVEQQALAQDYARCGVPIDVLDRQAITARSGSARYVGGLQVQVAGSLQPLSYTRELARACIQAGVSLFTGSRVSGLRQDKGCWTLSTANGSVTADTVLVCTNGYTALPAEPGTPGTRPTAVPVTLRKLSRKLVPVRSVLAATEPLPASLRESILPDQVTFVDKRRLILYARYDRDGRLCVGDHGPARDTFRLDDFVAVKRRALAVWPQLADVAWDYHWGGRVAMTRSSLPFIHEVTPGLIACMGYNGRGVGMGSVMGRVVADYVTSDGREEPAFPLTRPADFFAHRFHRPGLAVSVQWFGLLDHLDEIRAARTR